jgi:hypothetical protein
MDGQCTPVVERTSSINEGMARASAEITSLEEIVAELNGRLSPVLLTDGHPPNTTSGEKLTKEVERCLVSAGFYTITRRITEVRNRLTDILKRCEL